MFVEISGKQTGKTTRLVEHAANHLLLNAQNSEHRITVVSITINHGEGIKRKIVQKIFDILTTSDNNSWVYLTRFFGTDNFTSVVDGLKQRIYVKNTMIRRIGMDTGRYYVDEFSFINSYRLRVLEDSYYCTTPISNDFTVELLEYCRESGVDVLSYDIPPTMRGVDYLSDDVDMWDDFCIEHGLEMYEHPFVKRKINMVIKSIKRHRF
jgi:hypothetical protein